MNFINQFKCRCSAISKMMSQSKSNPCLTEKQAMRLIELESKGKITDNQKLELADLLVKKENSKKIILSDGCIEMLMEAYAWETYRKKPLKEVFEQQQMKKGKLAEGEGIKLLSVVDGVLHTKYEGERITNDYLSGLPDIFTGEEVMSATKITDIKNTFDYPTFLKKINNGLDPGNEEQVQGYLDITGAPEGLIAYTLVDMPEIMRADYKRRMFYDGNYVTEESPDFLKKWEEWEQSMTFVEIPLQQRVYKIAIQPFTDFERLQIYDKVKVCRQWLFEFDEKYKKLNS
jgi:hypothetical protein